MGDERCIARDRAQALGDALMATLDAQVGRAQPAPPAQVGTVGAALAG
jgi:hypothetical protein